MGLGKAFGLGLVIFVALNFLFAIIAALISNQFITFFGTLTNMSTLATALFGAVISDPTIAWSGMFGYASGGSFITAIFIVNLGYIIAPLIAAILTGKLAEGKKDAFVGWELVCLISSALVMVLSIVGGLAITLTLIITTIQAGLLLGVFYGCFALLACGSDYY